MLSSESGRRGRMRRAEAPAEAAEPTPSQATLPRADRRWAEAARSAVQRHGPCDG